MRTGKNTTCCEDREGKPGAKEFGHPLKTGKGKEINSSLESSEKNADCHQLDLNPVRSTEDSDNQKKMYIALNHQLCNDLLQQQ